MTAGLNGGFYPPQSGIKIGFNFPPTFGLRFPTPSSIGLYLLLGEVYVKGVE